MCGRWRGARSRVRLLLLDKVQKGLGKCKVLKAATHLLIGGVEADLFSVYDCLLKRWRWLRAQFSTDRCYLVCYQLNVRSQSLSKRLARAVSAFVCVPGSATYLWKMTRSLVLLFCDTAVSCCCLSDSLLLLLYNFHHLLVLDVLTAMVLS